jgi:methyl-accepting chemotaxis protein PixJ
MQKSINPGTSTIKESLSQNNNHPRHSAKAIALALCLSLIPAVGIGVTTYQLTNHTITEKIAQAKPVDPEVLPIIQKQILLNFILATGGTALLVYAISAFFTNRKKSPSPKPIINEKALLFGDIASLNQPVDLDYLYQRAVDGAREILSTDRVIVYLFDNNWNGIITAESVAPGYVQSLGNHVLDTCMSESSGGLYKNGRICVLNDITQAGLSDCHLQLLERHQVKANMVVPLLKDDQLLGLLIAHQCDKPRNWQDNEIDFFIQLASQISLKLSNKNFLEQKAKAEQERSISKVALRIRQSLDTQEIFNTAATAIRQMLNLDRVVICYPASSIQEGSVVAESVISGWTKTLGIKTANLGISEHDLQTLKNGYIHAVNNMSTNSGVSNNVADLLKKYQIKASLIAPINMGSQLQGLIIAHQCSTSRTWEQSEVELFEELAQQVSLALEQTTLLKTVEAEAKRTQLLADLTSRIRQSINSQDIFSISLEEVRKTLEIDRVLIYRFHPDDQSGEITSQSVSTYFQPVEDEKISKLLQEEKFTGYTNGKILVTHDVFEDKLKPAHAQLLERIQIKSSVVAPILFGQQLVGLLCAHQCSTRRKWQQSEFYLLKQLATQIGFALDQAKLIEQVKLVSIEQLEKTAEMRSQLINLVMDVEGVTKGDLTVRADVTEGEIGTVSDFFNAVIESLREIVKQVKVATTKVNSSIQENEGAISQLADVAFQQAQETNRTLKSVEEMTNSIQEVAGNANHAAAVARTASVTAEAGEKAMERTVEKILSLRETVAATAKKVKRLGESSQEISKVISLINQIALQTNLLAINAGIEAARAGEEGQGFAVVAKEVSELAARSAAATQEIENIVENIQIETNQVVEAMELGTTQVLEGTQLVKNTKESLANILEVSRKIDQLVASISTATVSQVQTSQSVTTLMKQMVIVSQETSKSSHQISHSLQETVAVAQQLQASVEVFKVDE